MNRQARRRRSRIESEVREAVCAGGGRAVFGLTFVAVVREGTELAVFLTAAGFRGGAARTITGAALGLAAAAALAWALFAASIRLDLRRFFQATNVGLILFAAGLVAKGIHEFNEVGWIPVLIDPLWNTRALLDEHSPAGIAAQTLFGYRSTPALTVVLGYLGYLLAAVAAIQPRRAGATSTLAPAVSGRCPPNSTGIDPHQCGDAAKPLSSVP